MQPPFQLMRVSEPPPESSCARTSARFSARFLFVATAVGTRLPSHGLASHMRALALRPGRDVRPSEAKPRVFILYFTFTFTFICQ